MAKKKSSGKKKSKSGALDFPFGALAPRPRGGRRKPKGGGS
jgi:hypothetical protein